MLFYCLEDELFSCLEDDGNYYSETVTVAISFCRLPTAATATHFTSLLRNFSLSQSSSSKQ